MSTEKRKVSTDALETLGNIIDDNAGRDAIHLAVEPVVAGEKLKIGDDVVLIGGKAFSYENNSDLKPLGIVDPFLTASVQKGERFWLIIYPRQITSLRHVWQHPDLPERDRAMEMLADNLIGDMKKIEEAKTWIIYYAQSLGLDYDELMEAAESHINHGDYLIRGGTFEGLRTSHEFWEQYEIVTNTKVGDMGNFFSCSC